MTIRRFPNVFDFCCCFCCTAGLKAEAAAEELEELLGPENEIDPAFNELLDSTRGTPSHHRIRKALIFRTLPPPLRIVHSTQPTVCITVVAAAADSAAAADADVADVEESIEA
jgi:hypothetical protein